uniref:Uncharacterized protein n=2 Tax=Caenorhabditis tropicalis TaxID=1561998 RepID=A0A1I7UXJ4_9PELO
MEMSLFSAPLAEMDIWRRARELTVEGFVISGIPPNFFGFETMQICFDVLTAAHVFGFATAWINSRGFKLLQLTYRTFNESHRLPEQLGPNFFEGPVTENEIRSWFIPIPGTENTLFVSLNPGNSIVMRKMLTRNVQVQILFNQEHF